MSDFNWPKPTTTHKPASAVQDTHSCQSETSQATGANAATVSVVYILALPSPSPSRSKTQVVDVNVMAAPSSTATIPSLPIFSLLQQTKPLDFFASGTTLVTLPVPTAASETTVEAFSTPAGDARIFVLATSNPNPISNPASTVSTPAVDAQIFVLATPNPTLDLASTFSPSPPPSSSLTPPPPSTSPQPHRLSSSAILGISVGTIALLSFFIVLFVILYRRRKRTRTPNPSIKSEQTTRSAQVNAHIQRAQALGTKRWRMGNTREEGEKGEAVVQKAQAGFAAGIARGEAGEVEQSGSDGRMGSVEGSVEGGGEGLLGSEWAARRALRSWPSGLDCHPISPIHTIPENDIGKAV